MRRPSVDPRGSGGEITARPGRVEGRVALVTGAASGIGLAAARLLAEEGASVVVADVRGFQDAAEGIQSRGGRAIGVEMDVTDAGAIDAAVALAVERFGSLGILVNNAGIGWPKPLGEIEEAEWDRIMAVNLKGPFLCSRAAAPHLANGGAIVNVSSVAGRSSSLSSGCHYSASKAGLLGLTRHLARELGPQGTRVNAVCPAAIESPFLTNIGMTEAARQMMAATPLGRIGMPDDIARDRLPRLGRRRVHHRCPARRQRRHLHGMGAPSAISISSAGRHPLPRQANGRQSMIVMACPSGAR